MKLPPRRSIVMPEPHVIGLDTAPPKPVGTGKSRFILVAKIDPYGCRKAVVSIRAKMDQVRRVIGSRHVGQQHVATIDNIPVWVCCASSLPAAPIWRIRDGLAVHGTAILFGNIGYGPADFPGDNAWLEEFVVFAPAGQFAPEGVDKAINDPVAPPVGSQS